MSPTSHTHPGDSLTAKSTDQSGSLNVRKSANTSVAVIMAAGASRRFGAADKRLASLPDGRRLLAATVASVADVFPALRVVLREGDDTNALGLAPDTPIIRAPHASEGLGASIGDAFAALARDAELADAQVAAILLGDMPALRPATLDALQREAGRELILRPIQAGRPGHPVLFGRAFWPELAALGDSAGGEEGRDEGARSVIRAHRHHYVELLVDDPGIHLDIDKVTDVARRL
ncbi:nucleotidyltransferase family protein [Halomonas sp. I5-271120]|uniref:nucleotidyltransferase family protein n=1 Tax=Halomonas sp. I5-271120 TaxID=3061632 RepID=UPI002714E915|nr:nucleotidyltransferase family protein [Halomonas sp. I5-271120]